MNLPNDLSGKEYGNMIIRQHKLLSNMLGAEIDFIVKGIDSKPAVLWQAERRHLCAQA